MAFTKIAAAGIGSTETVTLHSLEVLNNATVGGVLTYEDVTNVDSIGIVTARAGVLVGSGITLSKDGDIFATGISTISVINSDKISLGDNEFIHIGIGSDLKFYHDSNNSIIANSTGELLINSPIINLRDTSNNSRFRIEPAGNVNIAKNINVSGLTTTGIISAFTNTNGTTDLLTLHADADGVNNGVASIKFTGNAGNHSSYIKGGHTTNGDTILTFHTDTYASGFNPEERVRIDNDGNIGIGTDNPAQAVHINRSSGDSYLRIQGGTNQGTLINKTDGTLIGGFVSGGAVGGSANDIAVRAETGNNIVFAHGTTERLRIKSDGKVGIGENSPDALLHLSTGASTTCEIRLTSNNTGSGSGDRGRISVYSALNDGTEYQAGYVDIDRSSGTDDQAHLLVALNNGSSVAEKLRIRGSDGRVLIKNDLEFDTDGSGGLFGKFAVTNQAYTANANLDITITQGNYIFSVRSGGVYHYNAIYMVTYYDSADKNSTEILHGDYGTTATHTVIHNSNNNGTFRLTFNRNFDGINVRQIKLH